VKAQNIIDKCIEMFFKYGIKSVSMDDISRELGISKKTVYTHFENKKEIVEKAFIHFTKIEEQTITAIHQQASDALDEMFKITDYTMGFLRIMKPTLTYDLQKYYKPIFDSVQNKHYKFIEKIIAENLDRGKKEGLYRKTIDSTILAKLFIGNIMVMTDEKIFPSSEYLKSVVYYQSIGHHLYGIVNKSSLKKLEDYLKKLKS